MAGESTGKIIAGKYRIDAFIAASGFGELYRGENMLLDKPVSISIFAGDPKDSQLYFAESKAAAKVSHANVLNLTDFGTSDGVSYAVYEAASGELLSAAIEREAQLPVEMAADIAKQIAAGLSAAHEKGIVHGNLNTGNVLAFSTDIGDPAVKVFGFDTANSLNDTRAAGDPKRFSYLAPEQCSGSDVSDARGDVYSLGVVLFEMLAGVPPFTGETPTEVMMHHIDDAPPPLSAFRQDLPAAIEPVILKALAKDPNARYQTAAEFSAELNNATSAGPMPAAVRESSNNIWKTAFVVLVGVSLLTFALIYITSVKQTDPTTVQSDANGMPVQPINPATGIEEQNLSNLPPDYSSLGTNTNSATGMPEAYPGGDGYNPWANGGVPPAGAPAIPPGGQVIQVPQGQSPFMTDPNCIMQPSGILLCPVPVTPTPMPKATPTPKPTPAANANTGTAPVVTPTPRPATTPAKTPAPARTPAANKPDPNGDLN